MKLKAFFSFLLAATVMTAAAQSQGYKDGIEYYKAGQYENAKTILLNTLNQADTDQALANYYLGQTHLALGDKAAAKQCFDKGMAINPECAYNYVGLGALDLLNGNESSANDNFRRAQNLGKKNHEILVAIARAYYNADPVKYAEKVDKFLQKAHKDSKHAEPSIYILEGDMLYDQKNFGDAAAQYEMAINYDNTNPEGYVKYANAYFHVNPQFAIQKLEEFLQVAPMSALGQRELAEKYYEANYWNKASDLYGRYIQNPNHFPEDKARYSVLLYYGNHYEQSLQVANEILEQNPSNFLMQRLRFLNKAKLEQYEEAVAYGAAFFADNEGAYFTANDYITYADALTSVQNDSLALVQYEIAAEKFPKNTTILSTLSTLYTKKQNYVRAAETFDLYLENSEKPSLTDYYTASARWLNVAATSTDTIVKAEAAAKGIKYVDEVIARATPSPSYLQRKARLFIAGNNNVPNADAIATYNEMVSLLDQDPLNADANNPENKLAMYREAYMFALNFYLNVEPDEELAHKYNDLFQEVSAKINKD